MASIEVIVGGSYYLYKHLTLIKKRLEEDGSYTHTHTPEQNT